MPTDHNDRVGVLAALAFCPRASGVAVALSPMVLGVAHRLPGPSFVPGPRGGNPLRSAGCHTARWHTQIPMQGLYTTAVAVADADLSQWGRLSSRHHEADCLGA